MARLGCALEVLGVAMKIPRIESREPCSIRGWVQRDDELNQVIDGADGCLIVHGATFIGNPMA